MSALFSQLTSIRLFVFIRMHFPYSEVKRRKLSVDPEQINLIFWTFKSRYTGKLENLENYGKKTDQMKSICTNIMESLRELMQKTILMKKKISLHGEKN